MNNLMDFLSGQFHFPKPGRGSRRPPCTPDPPKDPEPVRPPKPFCTTGPDLGKLSRELKRAAKKKKR